MSSPESTPEAANSLDGLWDEVMADPEARAIYEATLQQNLDEIAAKESEGTGE